MTDSNKTSLAKLYADEDAPLSRRPLGRVAVFAFLYKARLKAQPVQELLALLGIAAGVALLFAVQIANRSITGSFDQLTKGIAGDASLEVAARSPQGFDERLFPKIERLSTVAMAAPVVERRISVAGPRGSRPLTLIGIDSRLRKLGGRLASRFPTDEQRQAPLGFYLTSPVARAIGVGPAQNVKVRVGERTVEQPVAGIFTNADIGSLAESPVALASLPLTQQIAAMSERISRVLVVPRSAAREASTIGSLKRLTANRLNVRRSDAEAKLLEQAAEPDRQSTTLFSVISLAVGLLLAYNAMLLTVSQRRKVVAALRMLGARRRTVLAALVFDAAVLGLAASIVGICLGDLLSRYVFHQTPGFLASAFAIGGQRIITTDTLGISVAGGMLATFAAAAWPAVELYRVKPAEVTHEEDPHLSWSPVTNGAGLLVWGGLGLIALTTAAILKVPNLTVIGMGILTVGIVMILSPVVTSLLAIFRRVANHRGGAIANISIAELAGTPTRAAALAATGALAVFGIVSLQGASANLKSGINQLSASVFGNADVWVTAGGPENAHGTIQFDFRRAKQLIQQAPGVQSVRIFRAAYYDWGARRVWLIGSPRNDATLVAPNQVVTGDLKAANQRLRRHRWAALTARLAHDRHLQIGESFSLPTAAGQRRFRLAATITNYGWPPGAVVINSQDFRALWKTDAATGLEVGVRPGVPLSTGQAEVTSALRSTPALKVQTTPARRSETASTTRKGLARLDQIANLVLAAAILAVVAAMLSAIWQRRARLASLRAIGMYRGELYRTLILETGLILLIGCFIGLAFGFLGQALASRYLRYATDFPVVFTPAWSIATKTLIATTLLGLVAAAIPSWYISRLSPSTTFSRE